jgi:hypothetical protein
MPGTLPGNFRWTVSLKYWYAVRHRLTPSSNNSPNSFYGHLLYRDVDAPRCVSTSRSAESLDGLSRTVRDCAHDYDTAKTTGQYWKMSVTDGVWSARVESEAQFGAS